MQENLLQKPCYHCGENCDNTIFEEEKWFCCSGCRLVYLLLNENKLCNYYDLDKSPGIKATGRYANGRFTYLDDEEIVNKLAQFVGINQVNITFDLPQIHCASCVFLLENLHRINKGVINSRVNFQSKEIFIVYDPQIISLKQLVELLAFIGYEPPITLNDTILKKSRRYDRKQILQLGVSGFCFANIMMLSFPEYFSAGDIQHGLKETFSWIIFMLSIPVLIYGASGIFSNAYKGLRQWDLNVDMPIALAIVITFAKSYFDIISGTGSGYLDSGTGIIFFMLIGRWFQSKTYDALSFDRDYLSYFPLGVTVLRGESEIMMPVTKLKKGELIVLKNGEMIPADSKLTNGIALIDYSFVSGEDKPILKNEGDTLFAGGRQKGGRILLQVLKEPSQSYITQLWNKENFSEKQEKTSFIHPWSRYFTLVLLSIALVSACFWYFYDSSKIITVVSAVLIIACPCSLLLTTTFTFGNMLRIFGRNKLFLKNALVIESMAEIDTIVLDKTGTITRPDKATIEYVGEQLNPQELSMVASLSLQSSHILSRKLAESFKGIGNHTITIFEELPGKGITGWFGEERVSLGNSSFTGEQFVQVTKTSSRVYARIGDKTKGFFHVHSGYRDNFSELVNELSKRKYQIHILSGDNDAERQYLEQLISAEHIQFNTSPSGKLTYIKNLQASGRKVMMMGDGLNDAGALKISNVGIAVNDNTSTFTPACDGILDGSKVTQLHWLLDFAKNGNLVITVSFIVSIIYNIAGISYAVQGKLSPLVAAILMPSSSITIVLLSTLLAGFLARKKGL